jgi:2-keto-4-pentenoate hydratase/2-oxohepta-3-ene-1,7-dioic acid hydratase in catechol pathway
MPIHVVRYADGNRARWGVLRGAEITPLEGEWPSTGDLIRQASLADLAAQAGATIDVREVELLSPVTRDQQFVCQGANYRQHMIESGVDPDVKTFNMIFTKASSCIVAAGSDVVRPRGVRFLDYEIELGLVLRRAISGRVTVTEATLPDYLAGLVIVNDYSARDVQIPQMQFYKGKSFRTFGPVGPRLCLLAPEDFVHLRALDLLLTVNGAVRQRDSTRNLIYGPAETLTELSGVHDLAAGDLIATGTPAGCALSVPSPNKQRLAALVPERVKWSLFFKQQEKRPYLQPGDVVEASIRSSDGAIDLGQQRNRIVEEV